MSIVLDALNGVVKFAEKLKGNATPLTYGFNAVTMTDANITLSSSQYDCYDIRISGTLTAGRNVVVPLTNGAEWKFTNLTGQILTIIGATGTGVPIATTKRAVVDCDGVNINRITADA